MLQKLTFSTILGLTFGVLLAGYAVFAYTPPTVVPTGGNVDAPINTGFGNQTKTGGLLNVFGLWIDQSLGVSGGASFGGIVDLGGNRIIKVGSPSASGDVATRGFVDSQTSGLQTRVSGVCSGGQIIRTINLDGSVVCE